MKTKRNGEHKKNFEENQDLPKERPDEAVDMEKLHSSLSLSISPDKLKLEKEKDSRAKPKEKDASEIVEEIADDMLHVLERIGALEEKINTNTAKIMELQESYARGFKSYGMELEKLKDALLSERKALRARSVLNAILPALETLQITRKAYKPQEDSAVVNQISALINMLRSTIQSLGFEPFEAQPGDAFDPFSMQCLDYAEGEEGKVVRTEKEGYKAGDTVVKPSGVVLGKSEKIH